MHAMMLMEHGDELVICDVNHPAQTIASTTYGKLISLSGCGLAHAAEAILTLFPLDTFVQAPVKRMVDDPKKQMPIFGTMQDVLDRANGSPVQMEALERLAFYEAARTAFAIVRTSDPGHYGCFILKMGIV